MCNHAFFLTFLFLLAFFVFPFDFIEFFTHFLISVRVGRDIALELFTGRTREGTASLASAGVMLRLLCRHWLLYLQRKLAIRARSLFSPISLSIVLYKCSVFHFLEVCTVMRTAAESRIGLIPQ
jgi:hypothetical protein